LHGHRLLDLVDSLGICHNSAPMAQALFVNWHDLLHQQSRIPIKARILITADTDMGRQVQPLLPARHGDRRYHFAVDIPQVVPNDKNRPRSTLNCGTGFFSKVSEPNLHAARLYVYAADKFVQAFLAQAPFMRSFILSRHFSLPST
jgi:hypothetical protein